jgi:hypothetical protein
MKIVLTWFIKEKIDKILSTTKVLNSDLLPPSRKECNYGNRAGQTDSSLTKFIVNTINIYVSK